MTGSLSLAHAFLRRDWAIARSYRAHFALEVVEAFVSLLLFFYLGRVVDGSKIASGTDISEGYFAFVVVGLAMMRLMQTGLTSFAFQLRRDQTTGTLEALLVTPSRQSAVILGSATYELLTAALLGVLMVVAAVTIFGVGLTIDASSLLVLLVAIPASACLFIALGVVIAGFTIVFKEITALLALVSSGLAVFAGVYFPISVLPGALHGVASALPFTWALELLRAALLGGDVSSTKMLLLVLCAAAAVPISFWLFDRSVARAKRAGSLAQY